MNFLEELQARGLVHDISDEKIATSLPPGSAFYVGFDPTAASLQIGNLIPLIVALHLGRAGFKPIILFGGATGAIGDPSGRNSERLLLERETIDQNIERQKKSVSDILGRVGIGFSFVNNFDWTKNISVLEFLRDVGKHFTVNYMLSKDVVKNRLEGEGISFTEFSYMTLQANDFLHLYQSQSCRLQLGGSDQWGNITAGLELIRKKIQGDAYALSWPLLTNAQGKKFGKSESGALWLSAEMTSPYKLHQFWLNTDDQDVFRYLKIFTFIPLAELESRREEWSKAPEKREAQQLLADSVCTLVHGEQATQDAKRSAKVLFGGSLEGLSETQLGEIFSDVPSVSLAREQVHSGSSIDLLVAAGAVKSKGEAKRLVTSGGAYLNNERIENADQLLKDSSYADRSMLVLRTGKKNYYLVKVT